MSPKLKGLILYNTPQKGDYGINNNYSCCFKEKYFSNRAAYWKNYKKRKIKIKTQ